jgi:hypothetical protein
MMRETTEMRCFHVIVSMVATVSFGALIAAPSARASAGDATRSGEAVIVDANDGSRALSHGESATKFSLRLPQGASCPGDSANDQWRFQSFMIPAVDDPGTLHYTVVGPDGPSQYPLYLENTDPIADSLLNANAVAGQPGVIPPIPPLSFAVFPPDYVTPGTYKVGVACTLSRQTSQYWDTTIVITAALNDRPSKFVWRLADAPASVLNSDRGRSHWPIAVGATLVAALTATGLVARRRVRPPSSPSPTPSPTGRSAVVSSRTPVTASKEPS